MPKHTALCQEELLSDDIQEIISYHPHWIVRKGNSFFLLIMAFFLSLTWTIRYPDIIHASARIVALNPPKLIPAKVEGKVLRLLVHNDQIVQKGQHLGYMESTADYAEVIQLQIWIDKVIIATQNSDYAILTSYPLATFYNLGELQVSYQAFQNELVEAMQTLTNGYYEKKKTALKKDLQFLTTLKSNAYQQQDLVKQDEQLQKKEYDAYETLAKGKVIAPLELNQYKSKLLSKGQTLKQIDAQITTAEVNSHSKEKELLDLQKTVFDHQQKFHSALLELKSDINTWVEHYVLVAPEEGKVMFISSLQEDEFVVNGQELFYIQPRQTRFYAEVMASQVGLGKLEIGQKVLIKVESYPSVEFGHLIGRVQYISNMPNRRDSFLIKVDLPNGLRTNFNRLIFFRNNLSAQAEIITEDRKLFERLIGRLKQLWHHDS